MDRNILNDPANRHLIIRSGSRTAQEVRSLIKPPPEPESADASLLGIFVNRAVDPGNTPTKIHLIRQSSDVTGADLDNNLPQPTAVGYYEVNQVAA